MTLGEADYPAPPLLFAVRSLHDALCRFDAAAQIALEIGPTDLRALNLLEVGAVSAGEIGTALGLTSGTVTALIDRLTAAGYVSRHPAPDDRRKVMVALEPATYQAFASIYAPCGQAVRAAGDALDPDALDAALRAIEAVTTAVREQERRLRIED